MKEYKLFQSCFREKNYKVFEYMKELYYYKNPVFFKLDKYEDGRRPYMNDKSFEKWKDSVLKDNLFINDSYKKISERRKGELSNATLCSSSRMAIELFSNKNNVVKLLKQLGLQDNGYKIELEHKYYCGIPHSYSNMDVSIFTKDKDNNNVIVAIECKMQELYEKNWIAKFAPTYESKLKELHIPFSCENSKLKATLMTNSSFDYKQQICHFLGLTRYAEENNCIIYFLNLVFDPNPFFEMVNEDIQCIEKRYTNYIEEERLFWNWMKENLMSEQIKAKFKFCGQFNQKFEKVEVE